MQTVFLYLNISTDIVGVLGLVTLPCMVLLVSHWSWWKLIIAWWKLIIALWSLDEIRSYINHQCNLLVISRRPKSKTSLETRSKFAKSILDNLGDPSATANELMGNWVAGKGKLTTAHLAKLIILLVFEKPAGQLTEAEIPLARQVVRDYRRKLGLPKAYKGQSIQVFSPGINPGEIRRKPMIFYRTVQVFRFGFGMYLGMCGFRFHCLKGSKHPFWVRFGNSKENPLVFIGGSGTGVSSYGRVIARSTEAYPNRTIALLEAPYISFYPAAPVSTMDDAMVDVDDILISLSIGACSWISHSYGSILLAWIVNFRPHVVKRATLVDPINFRLWDASLVRRILHDQPRSFAENFLQDYLVSEPTIAHTFTTHSDWLLNNIFPESLTIPTNIFFSDHEFIFDVKGCKAYLDSRLKANNQTNVTVSSMDTTHGGFQYQENYLTMTVSFCE